MRYQFTVPPTHDVGSYKSTCSNKYSTKAADALSDYNSARDHDGLPPITRMPAGTVYAAEVEYVLQGNYGYGHGWEDLVSEDTRKEARAQLRCYAENEGGNYRIVRRAVS